MHKVMLMFKRELLEAIPRIKRTACVDEIIVEDLPKSEFALVSKWPGGEYRQVFSREFVLGPTASAPPLRQRPRQRLCAFRDDYIRKLLDVRTSAITDSRRPTG